MKKKSETITFFGSGPVAAASLELLVQDFSVEAVVTKPQPAHHKEPFPVLEVAKKLGLKTFTPSSRVELSKLFQSSPCASRLGVVIDYGFIINHDVIDYFPLGIVNCHFSLLPQWRGADPISFAILSGQKKTGISIMLITAGMDEGPLLAQAELTIKKDATTPQLTDELISLSHSTLREVLPRYINGLIEPRPQEEVTIASSKRPSYSRKLTKNDGRIDWTKTATQIEREIRAFYDWPRSHTLLNNIELIVKRAAVIDESGTPGDFTVTKSEVVVYCGEQALQLLRVQPPGKKEMSAEAFIAGYGSRLI